MAYRDPVFFGRHFIRDAVEIGGTDELTTPDPVAAGFPLTNIADDLNGRLFKWSTAITNHEIVIDRGTAASLRAVQAMIIPAGHNMGDVIINVAEDDIITFPAPTNIFAAVQMAPGTGLNVFTGGEGEFPGKRFVRLTFVNSGAHQMGEVVLSNETSLVRGPDPQWSRVPTNNAFQAKTRAGVSFSRVLGSVAELWQIQWNELTGADKANLERILSDIPQAGHPFWFTPPDDTLPAAINVQLVRDAEYLQASTAPQVFISQDIRLRFEEVLG